MYKKILFAVDLGQPQQSRKALATTIGFAQTLGSEVFVATVVPDFGMSIVGSFFPAGFEKKAIEEGRQQLEKYCAEKIPDGITHHLVIGHGAIYEEIINAAKAANCDLIIMASHRPELEDFLLGPNAAKVVRHAPMSVMVVR